MGSLITHFEITKILLEKYNLEDKVLLGALLPDMLKISKLKTKAESHYLDESTKLPDVKKYIDTKKKDLLEPVNLGYLFHLIQDEIWYHYLNELDSNHTDGDEFMQKIYSDLNICDKYILDKLNIDEEEFAKWKQKVMMLTDDETIKKCIKDSFIIRKIENEQAYFVTEVRLIKYVNECIDRCEEYYKQLVNQYK